MRRRGETGCSLRRPHCRRGNSRPLALGVRTAFRVRRPNRGPVRPRRAHLPDALRHPSMFCMTPCALAASCTLREISLVDPRCCSTAGSDFCRDLVYLADRGAYLANRFGRCACGIADRLDLIGNLLRRLGGLGRECLHFARHHGKAPACLACSRGFDGRVQSQQIRLSCNVLNEPITSPIFCVAC